MKIGLFLALFGDKSLDDALDAAKSEGLQAVEIGVGAYPGAGHLPNLEDLLTNHSAQQELRSKLESRDLVLSALSCHGNPIHPDPAIANEHHLAFQNAVRLAGALGVPRVNGFSGCPGDHAGAKYPNWVTCAWPDEFRDILEYQWNEVAIPYWREQHRILDENGVNFAIEMHPGFLCYNNDTLLRLRKEVGPRIGSNFDPSHLWWQGIDPIVAVRELAREGALFHVHAKDTRIDPLNADRNGNLDTKSYGDILERSWVFRSVGYGHGVEWWKEFCSTLRAVGYDDVLSIEHEDGLMSPMEGLRKALDTLRQAVIAEPAGEMFWAKE